MTLATKQIEAAIKIGQGIAVEVLQNADADMEFAGIDSDDTDTSGMLSFAGIEAKTTEWDDAEKLIVEAYTASIIEAGKKDEDVIRRSLASGFMTILDWEDVFDGSEVVEDALVLDPGRWHADDGNSEVEGEFDSGYDAAKDYVDTGDWGDIGHGTSVSVTVWRMGIDSDGDDVHVDEKSHTIDILPEEPECPAGEHEWTSAHEGGCRENPGCWAGNGTSMAFRSHCEKCGMQKDENSTGMQRNPGDSDTVEYSETDAAWVIENISPNEWSEWVIEQAAENHVDAAVKQLRGYDDDERFGVIFTAATAEENS